LERPGSGPGGGRVGRLPDRRLGDGCGHVDHELPGSGAPDQEQ
jgi:hypothetical protein